jgi:CBS domain-containing protein
MMKVRQIMTPDPQAVTPDETVSRAARIMRDLDVGIVPVVQDQNSRKLRGVITDRDIAVRHVADGHNGDCRVGDHMSEDITRATPDDDVDDLMRQMQTRQIRRVPVVDADERLVGIVAQADIAIEMGPREPTEVVETLEKISEPVR